MHFSAFDTTYCENKRPLQCLWFDVDAENIFNDSFFFFSLFREEGI